MNSPSPSKPKWTPGGAIRRTSTILSIGRSKTPSRSSSIHDSDSSPSKDVAVKGVAAKGAAAPVPPAPKSVPPKSTLSTGSPLQEPTATPSKSPLARMGTALRRPSSLIPRRRTTSTASSFRDGDSTPSKAASALRSSTELEPAIKQNPPAEPATTQAPKSTVPEPRPSVPESEHVLPPVIESNKLQSAEETPSRDVFGHLDLSSSREHAAPATKEALDEPLALSAAIVSELAPILLLAEQISAEAEVVQPSRAPISTAAPVSKQPPAQLEDTAPAPTLEPVSRQLNTQLEAGKSSLAPIPAPEPASEHVDPQLEAGTSSTAPLSTPEPASEPISAHLEVEEPSTAPHSTLEPLPALATDAVAPSSETEEQSTVSISTKEAVPPSPIPPTQSLPEVIEDVLPSAGPTQDEIVETPPVVTSPLPVTRVDIGPSSPEPLREVSSLNSSFEDLSLPTQPEDEIVVVQKDILVVYPNVLLTSVVSVPIETTEKEKVSPVAVVPAAESSSIKSAMPILEITEESEAEAPVAPALPVTHEPRRSLPLEIPTASAESAAPSPAATHPLLPLEVQEFPPRPNNGPLGPVRDHYTKTPQEYRSMLRMLFDELIGLIRRWRRCLW